MQYLAHYNEWASRHKMATRNRWLDANRPGEIEGDVVSMQAAHSYFGGT